MWGRKRRQEIRYFRNFISGQGDVGPYAQYRTPITLPAIAAAEADGVAVTPMPSPTEADAQEAFAQEQSLETGAGRHFDVNRYPTSARPLEQGPDDVGRAHILHLVPMLPPVSADLNLETMAANLRANDLAKAQALAGLKLRDWLRTSEHPAPSIWHGVANVLTCQELPAATTLGYSTMQLKFYYIVAPNSRQGGGARGLQTQRPSEQPAKNNQEAEGAKTTPAGAAESVADPRVASR